MWVFPKCFHWIQWIQWYKILNYINIIRTYHFLCKRPGCYHSNSRTQVAKRTFKLSPIQASVIYQIPSIRRIHWILDLFRENFIVPQRLRLSQVLIVLVDGFTVDRGYVTIINSSLSQPAPRKIICYVMTTVDRDSPSMRFPWHKQWIERQQYYGSLHIHTFINNFYCNLDVNGEVIFDAVDDAPCEWTLNTVVLEIDLLNSACLIRFTSFGFRN